MPEVPDRVTMPLLTRITQQSLDEDYLSAAERRVTTTGGPPRHRHRSTAAVIVVFGILVTTAAVQTTRNAGVDKAGRATLISQITSRRAMLSRMEDRLARMREQVVDLGDEQTRLSASEQVVNSRLRRLEVRTGYVPVTGEGVRIVVDDAPHGDATQKVRDEDLAILVDGLWNAGAEAIAINDQRLTVLSGIRNVGVGIRVNSRPLSPPYTVLAIGDTQTLQARLLESTHGQEWFGLVEQLGFEFSMHNEDRLSLPAARMRPLVAVTAGTGAESRAEHPDEKETP